MNEICKAGRVERLESNSVEMAEINRFSLKELTPESVFTFKVAMCDNAVDRTSERFTENCLLKLAELYVGKTVIFDDKRSAENQVARVYKTEITEGNAGYQQLVGHCYMVRTATNQDLITEIEAGIKKEVSVSCSVGKMVCNICGTNNANVFCEHWPGREYDGKACVFELSEPGDAYELSFVPVPAQPAAGTLKRYEGKPLEKHGTEPKEDTRDATEICLKTVESFIFSENERCNVNE